jgi:hypothetical protein
MTIEQELLDLKIKVEKLEQQVNSLLFALKPQFLLSGGIQLCQGQQYQHKANPGIDVLPPIYGK